VQSKTLMSSGGRPPPAVSTSVANQTPSQQAGSTGSNRS
jgi:hypothetical protein